MKYFFGLFLLFSGCTPAFASFIQPLDSDAFTQEKADETAKIINENFVELFNSKVSTESAQTAIGAPTYFVGDILDPDGADDNAFFIMENADELWREKEDVDGLSSVGGRSIQLADILDPNNIEDTIRGINQIFYELDNAKVEIQ